MKMKNAVSSFYLEMIINELRLMSSNVSYLNISYNSLLYLDIIACTKNCTVSYIANALHVAKSAVTLKVNELSKQGLVVKKQSENDKRIFYLSVNQSVIDEYKLYNRVLYNAVKTVEKKYSKNEVNKFCEMLSLISQYFSEEIECQND